jgi:MerR family transcriptional regulator, light-induced transcriptional regulator
MSYRIKSVATLTGLTTSTLRAWERRYRLVSPERTRGGYRVYTADDVARLTRIKSLLDNGFKVSEAIALVEREVPALAPSDAPAESLERIRLELLEALLQMDRPRARQVTSRLASLTFERRIDEILLPIMRAVGDLWACGEANVAQEHFASAFVREKLAGMLDELDAGPASGPEVICACVPGEQHELGLLAAAVHLALHGWRVTYLGADLPYEDLRQTLVRRSPPLLCVALVVPRSAAECGRIAEHLREAAPERTRVVIGGAGIARDMADPVPPRVHWIPALEDLLGSDLIDPHGA